MPALPVIEIARDQIGIKEATGKNDGEPSNRYMGGRKEPWCAHFVAWVFRQAGTPIPGDTLPTETRGNPLASVAFMERVFQDHEWFYMSPKPGDIVFFGNRGSSDAGPGRHCGIVESVEPGSPGRIVTVEGNLSNSVRRVTHSISSVRITGYGRMPNKE